MENELLQHAVMVAQPTSTEMKSQTAGWIARVHAGGLCVKYFTVYMFDR